MNNLAIAQDIVNFATIAIENGGWMDMDRLYLQNRIKTLIGYTDEFDSANLQTVIEDASTLAKRLVDSSFEKKSSKKINEYDYHKKLLDLLDLLTPPTSVVNALFAQHYSKSPKEATDYFYQLSKTNQTIQNEFFVSKNCEEESIDGHTLWRVHVANENIKDYPFLQRVTSTLPYSFELEGHCGNTTEEILTSRRIIRMNLQGESYGFQFLKDAFVPEHCVVVAEKEESRSLRNQLDHVTQLVEIFPDYFMMGNLEIVSENEDQLHCVDQQYQGGRLQFPILKAQMKSKHTVPLFPEVVLEKLDWPITIWRLKSTNRQELVKAAEYLIRGGLQGDGFDDDFLSKQSDGQAQNALLMVVKRQNGYELYVGCHSKEDVTLVNGMGAFGLFLSSNQVTKEKVAFKHEVQQVLSDLRKWFNG